MRAFLGCYLLQRFGPQNHSFVNSLWPTVSLLHMMKSYRFSVRKKCSVRSCARAFFKQHMIDAKEMKVSCRVQSTADGTGQGLFVTTE